MMYIYFFIYFVIRFFSSYKLNNFEIFRYIILVLEYTNEFNALQFKRTKPYTIYRWLNPIFDMEGLSLSMLIIMIHSHRQRNIFLQKFSIRKLK